MKFPVVIGSNLLRRKITLPDDLQGDLNIIFIAFQRWQQSQVNSWLPEARRLEKVYPGVRYYELPTIYQMNVISKTFLNEGMRAGIPNQTAHDRTITLYLNKIPFRRALGIANEDEITVMLLNREGEVLWRETGVHTADKAEALIQMILEASPAAGEPES